MARGSGEAVTPIEKRANEVVEACSRASYEGIDPRSVLLIALDAAERRGEERVLRWMKAVEFDDAIDEYRKARRARVGRRKWRTAHTTAPAATTSPRGISNGSRRS